MALVTEKLRKKRATWNGDVVNRDDMNLTIINKKSEGNADERIWTKRKAKEKIRRWTA